MTRFFLGLALLLLAACGPSIDPMDTAVKVTAPDGHGSGTHIGGGLILTAAHVVTDRQEVEVRWASGQKARAVTIWRAPAEDIAILRYEGPPQPSASLECAHPVQNLPVQIIGNPGPAEFIRFRGHTASGVAERGPWRASVVVDATAAKGVSGGGVFDSHGRIVGVLVGIFAGGLSSVSGISVMVPASAICAMMGRRA